MSTYMKDKYKNIYIKNSTGKNSFLYHLENRNDTTAILALNFCIYLFTLSLTK